MKIKITKSLFTLLILPTVILAQTTGGGVIGGGGAIGGGQSSIIKKEVTTVFNKNLLTGLGQRIAKPKSVSKQTTAKKTTAKSSQSNSKSSLPAPSKTTKSLPSDTTAIKYKPIKDTGVDTELAAMFSQNPDDQNLFLTIFQETKKAYEIEANKLNKRNDVALATTFFIATCITVYHQTPEPSDAATDALYESLADVMLSSPETAQMSDLEKQVSSEKLIYLSGLILTGYLLGKQGGDQQTLEAYRQVAAVCFQSFTNLNIEQYIFDSKGLKLKS